MSAKRLFTRWCRIITNLPRIFTRNRRNRNRWININLLKIIELLSLPRSISKNTDLPRSISKNTDQAPLSLISSLRLLWWLISKMWVPKHCRNKHPSKILFHTSKTLLGPTHCPSKHPSNRTHCPSTKTSPKKNLFR